MPAPLIGITSARTLNPNSSPLHGVSEAYIRAVDQAGGVPVLIPLGLPQATIDVILGRLDGILFSGGGDVHPRRYAAEGHSKVNSIDEDRDRVEFRLVEAAAVSGRPFLGICRGLQVINIALGGSLYADILDDRPGALKHDYFPNIPRDYLAHPVQVEPGSRLASLLGELSPQVNSLHHQGIREMAPGLQATARAPDGLVEAVELPGHPFGLAVQWHPEWLQAHESMRRLFQAFVTAAGKDQ